MRIFLAGFLMIIGMVPIGFAYWIHPKLTARTLKDFVGKLEVPRDREGKG